MVGRELDQLSRLWRLNRIVLGEVANDNIGIQPNHYRLRGSAFAAAPAAAASPIASIVTGRRDLTMPRKMAAGRFGKRTTLPSGCMKNLSRSPGFNPRCSRMAFGIVAWPLLVSADSMDDLLAPYHFIKCNTLPPCVHPPGGPATAAWLDPRDGG